MPVGIYKRTKKNSNKGKHLSKEWRNNIKKGNQMAVKEGRHKSWNKGLTKETDERLMNTSKNLKGKISWSKGLTKKNNLSLRCMSKLLKNHTPWNKGLNKKTDKRIALGAKKISKKMKGRFNPHSEKAKVNMKKATAKRILEGKQKLGANGKKFANVITYFYSKKNKKIFRTVSKTIELPCAKYLENDNNVISYDMNCLVIKYWYERKWHNYFPDFVVIVKNGKNMIIECKHSSGLKYPQIQIKAEAARRYCKKHNMEYKFWTENGFVS